MAFLVRYILLARLRPKLWVAACLCISIIIICASHTDISLYDPSFLPRTEALKYYRSLGWKVYPHRHVRRKIYDLIPVNNEMDWVEARVNELQHAVDYFVLVQSPYSFTGLPKPLLVKENLHRFGHVRHKLIHHVLDLTSRLFKSTWERERFQRDATFEQIFPMLTGEQKATTGDVILVPDVDEIPKPETLTVLRNCAFLRRVTLRSRFYYYSFQWLHRGADWSHPQATFYDGAHTVKPATLRDIGHYAYKSSVSSPVADPWNASWHCSSCFATLDEMVTKITSFSHTEFNRPEFVDRSEIVRRVRHGVDLFDRDLEVYDQLRLSRDVPSYVKANTDRFSYMLERRYPNASFSDYHL